MIAPPSWSRRSPSSRSTRRRWSSSIATTAIWQRPPVFRAIGARRRSAPIRALSPDWPGSSVITPSPQRKTRRCCRSRRGERLARGRLSLGQSAAHRRRDRLDGRAALSAAALCLSCRGARGIGPGGDLRDHGTPAAARDHVAGRGDDLRLWLVARGGPRRRRLAARLGLGEARSCIVVDRVSLAAGVLAARFRRGALLTFGSVLPNRQRIADLGDDRDRPAGGGQTVLSSLGAPP